MTYTGQRLKRVNWAGRFSMRGRRYEGRGFAHDDDDDTSSATIRWRYDDG